MVHPGEGERRLTVVREGYPPLNVAGVSPVWQEAPLLHLHIRGYPPQSVLLAMRAPSAIAANFIYAISGSTGPKPAKVLKPQSLPAITRSRPTMLANRQMR